MVPSDLPLALTVCLILSVGWSALLLAVCRVAEKCLPASDDRHVLWWLGLAAAAAPLGALAVLGLAGTAAVAGGPPPMAGAVFGMTVLDMGAAGEETKESWRLLPIVLAGLQPAAIPAAALYGAGLVWHLLGHVRARRRLQAFLAACRPLGQGALRASVADWATRLGLKAMPPVLITPEPCSPFSAHGRRPVLVMPEGLLRQCSDGQAALICAHELAHVARRDFTFIRLQNILRALLWFNPVAGVICARIETTREAACDDRVLNIDRSVRRDYARAFLEALRHSAEQPAGGIPFIHPCRKDHEMRLTNIMNGLPAAPRKARLALIAISLSVAAVPCAGGQAALAGALAGKVPGLSGAVVSSPAARVSSPFGPRKLNGKAVFHGGVDIAAPPGTPVLSPGKGRVVRATAENPNYGKLVEIDYGDGWKLRFARLDSWSVESGDAVAAGRQIGTVGASGTGATGPHLHLEVWRKGKIVDPATVLALPGQGNGGATRIAARTAEACKGHPVPVHQPPPAYPFPGLEGRVVVEFAIGPDGRTKDVKVVKSTDKRLNQAAVDAVRQWRYEPCAEGQEHKGVKVVIEFKMNKKSPEQKDKEPSAGR